MTALLSNASLTRAIWDILSMAHINAKTLDEAAALMQKGKATMIAGGTDPLGTLRFEILPNHPEVVINLKSIPGLDCFKEEGIFKSGSEPLNK
jgi:CO/xanthine dehydrogenase FAD-binding subunit